jgi:hypothetical protein
MIVYEYDHSEVAPRYGNTSGDDVGGSDRRLGLLGILGISIMASMARVVLA